MSVMSESPAVCPAPNAGHFPHLSTGIFPHDHLGPFRHKAPMRNGGSALPVNALDAVLERVDAKLSQLVLSDREASLAAVGKPDLIRDMRRGKGIPRGDRLAALARVLGTTTDWLLYGGFEGEAEARAALNINKVRSEVAQGQLSAFRALSSDNKALPPLPLLGTVLAGDVGMPEAELELVELNYGEVLQWLQRPPALASDSDAYALTILSDSMFPRFSPGEQIAVSPRAPVSIGDDVVVQLRGRTPANDDPEADRVRTVLVKRLVRRTATYVELQQFNPDMTFKVENERVASVHKVGAIMFS